VEELLQPGQNSASICVPALVPAQALGLVPLLPGQQAAQGKARPVEEAPAAAAPGAEAPCAWQQAGSCLTATIKVSPAAAATTVKRCRSRCLVLAASPVGCFLPA
jgi:hypothetical protein